MLHTGPAAESCDRVSCCACMTPMCSRVLCCALHALACHQAQQGQASPASNCHGDRLSRLCLSCADPGKALCRTARRGGAIRPEHLNFSAARKSLLFSWLSPSLHIPSINFICT